MTTTAVRVAAGWYADPLSADGSGQPTHRRWWDGHGWTHHTALIGDTPRSVDTAWSAPTSPDISPATVEAMRLSASYTHEARREAARVAETMPLHRGTPVFPLMVVDAGHSAEQSPTIGGLAPTALDVDEVWTATPAPGTTLSATVRRAIGVSPRTALLTTAVVLGLVLAAAAILDSGWFARILAVAGL
jgi:hypothetical protein